MITTNLFKIQLMDLLYYIYLIIFILNILFFNIIYIIMVMFIINNKYIFYHINLYLLKYFLLIYHQYFHL